MKTLAFIVALVLAVPSADAAVIATTKQKQQPVIDHAFVSDDLRTFGFDVVKAPTTNAYDVWGRLVSKRGTVVGEWFIRSMKFRRRTEKVNRATFTGNLADTLTYAGDGTYALTFLACPANLKKPNERGCATTATTVTYKAK